ncbi:lipopolysaccharide kinase InaA family protein [Pseudomonas sp. 5P_3.1_Bac2]|uniref:lipopolysaccharide kinase InaA family protein n=1 Tax=Pseudomonas sp. 5P_3.1_Bac2 TaxID=2971617 RepID=UPI0021C851D1|nr:lipopolysaccharide kinase InaA family protein [Pseudomonas sp. 5P_3.1_Bac2]MCU1718344.1 lipopolysaccharide kinase InaA family protein [Pseudomonas sp. 5P_3.1_Bac2]
MAGWKLDPAYAHLVADFGSLDAVFALQGEKITKDPLSDVIRIERGGVRYYVKRYREAGSNIRRYIGRPRIKSEWQNLKRFAKWGIPTAEVVAWGMERRLGMFQRGAMITRELANTQSLLDLADNADERLSNPRWVQKVSLQVAKLTRRMHDRCFTHNDLKWRNILVDDSAQVFLIDCPGGTFWWGPWLNYRMIKDLACLDKVGQRTLSASQRLRFYLQYRGYSRLKAEDKTCVRRILKFFEGRE